MPQKITKKEKRKKYLAKKEITNIRERRKVLKRKTKAINRDRNDKTIGIPHKSK